MRMFAATEISQPVAKLLLGEEITFHVTMDDPSIMNGPQPHSKLTGNGYDEPFLKLIISCAHLPDVSKTQKPPERQVNVPAFGHFHLGSIHTLTTAGSGWR